YEYNTHGQCTAIISAADANGYRRRDTAQYYESGPQMGYLHTWTVDAQGPTVVSCSCQYDARGNVIEEIDPRGFATDCIYNALDEPVRMDRDVQLSPRLRV